MPPAGLELRTALDPEAPHPHHAARDAQRERRLGRAFERLLDVERHVRICECAVLHRNGLGADDGADEDQVGLIGLRGHVDRDDHRRAHVQSRGKQQQQQ
jgi:hypothetical protein